MREFFRGWRRKLGCVALVMAFAVLAMWIRSYSCDEWIERTRSNVRTSVGSQDGGILLTRQWWAIDSHGPWSDSPLRGFSTTDSRRIKNIPYHHGALVDWSYQVAGFYGSSGTDLGGVSFEFRMIPYWSLVLTLTLLSAYLIVWKPRPKSKEPQNA